jgi:hypothetical protein
VCCERVLILVFIFRHSLIHSHRRRCTGQVLGDQKAENRCQSKQCECGCTPPFFSLTQGRRRVNVLIHIRPCVQARELARGTYIYILCVCVCVCVCVTESVFVCIRCVPRISHAQLMYIHVCAYVLQCVLVNPGRVCRGQAAAYERDGWIPCMHTGLRSHEVGTGVCVCVCMCVCVVKQRARMYCMECEYYVRVSLLHSVSHTHTHTQTHTHTHAHSHVTALAKPTL